MVYDDVTNLTWVANANLGAGSSYDDGGSNTDGQMTWSSATAWASALDYGGKDDWRLPATLQPDLSCDSSFDAFFPLGIQYYGYNCKGSELGNLFYDVFGATQGNPILSGSDISNLDLFTNILYSVYWSGTQYATSTDVPYAWSFATGNGYQSFDYGLDEFYGWAVRDGDVAAVPEPATLALLGLGLGLAGLGFSRRRKSGQA